jgi:ubiquinone/menaquinone biosynthesis C-methylase UbiE
MRLQLVLGLLALVATAGLSLGWQQQPVPFKAQDEDRELHQRPGDVLKALEIGRGSWVADVGAGNGYYVRHMADLVGPTGKVFAEEISDEAIEFLHLRVKMFDLRNVEIIKGAEDDPKLPSDSLTAVLVVNTYHHFRQHVPMLRRILRSLKPGGRFVIVDYSLPEHRSQNRAEQLKIHEIDPGIARTEVGEAGFQVLKSEDPFLKRMPEVSGDRIGASDMWLMVAIRPQ